MSNPAPPSPDREEDDEELEQPQETDPSGRFVRLAEVLGAGAFKTVYKGVDLEKGTEVAWNKLRPGVTEADFRKLYEEVRLLEHLVHPRIIDFIHSWIDSEHKQLVFITEYMTSGTLKQYVKKSNFLKLKVIKEWCQQILEGIAYLHSHDPPIIHRDIKCDNIFINGSTCEVKIGDLGLATVTRQNNSMSVIGTPEYMAPEFYTEHYHTGVDIWAFGLTMLEMITGDCPYSECENIAQIFRKVSNGVLPHLQLDRVVDEDIKNFICLCLSPPQSRPSAQELLNHQFLVDKSDEKSNMPVELLDRKSEEPTPTRPSLDGDGLFVVGLDDENPGEVMLVDALELGQNMLQLKLKLNLTEGGEQDISFSFNLYSDTAAQVSEEMVAALNLQSSAKEIITRLIQKQVDMFTNAISIENLAAEDAIAETTGEGQPPTEHQSDTDGEDPRQEYMASPDHPDYAQTGYTSPVHHSDSDYTPPTTMDFVEPRTGESDGDSKSISEVDATPPMTDDNDDDILRLLNSIPERVGTPTPEDASPIVEDASSELETPVVTDAPVEGDDDEDERKLLMEKALRMKEIEEQYEKELADLRNRKSGETNGVLANETDRASPEPRDETSETEKEEKEPGQVAPCMSPIKVLDVNTLSISAGLDDYHVDVVEDVDDDHLEKLINYDSSGSAI